MKMGARNGGDCAIEWNASTRGEVRVQCEELQRAWTNAKLAVLVCGKDMARKEDGTTHDLHLPLRPATRVPIRTCTCGRVRLYIAHEQTDVFVRVDLDLEGKAACQATLRCPQRILPCAWSVGTRKQTSTQNKDAHVRVEKRSFDGHNTLHGQHQHIQEGSVGRTRRFSRAPRIALARVQRPSCQPTPVPSVCRVSSPTSYARMCTHLCLRFPASLALALHDVASTVVASRRRTTCDLEGSWNVVPPSSHVLVVSSDVGWRFSSMQATCTCAWRRRTCSA